jgi:hypothetical protein
MFIPQDSVVSPTAQVAQPAPSSADETPKKPSPWTPTNPQDLKVDIFTSPKTQSTLQKTMNDYKVPIAVVGGVGNIFGLLYRSPAERTLKRLEKLDPGAARYKMILGETLEEMRSSLPTIRQQYEQLLAALPEDEAKKLRSLTRFSDVSDLGLSGQGVEAFNLLKKLNQLEGLLGQVPEGLTINGWEDIFSTDLRNFIDETNRSTLNPKLLRGAISSKRDQEIASLADDLLQVGKPSLLNRFLRPLSGLGLVASSSVLAGELYDYFQEQDPENISLEISYDSKSSALKVTSPDISGSEKSATENYTLLEDGEIVCFKQPISNESGDLTFDIANSWLNILDPNEIDPADRIIDLYINLANAHNKADDNDKPIIETQIKHIQDFINAHLDRKQSSSTDQTDDLGEFERLTKLKNLPFTREVNISGNKQ